MFAGVLSRVVPFCGVTMVTEEFQATAPVVTLRLVVAAGTHVQVLRGALDKYMRPQTSSSSKRVVIRHL